MRVKKAAIDCGVSAQQYVVDAVTEQLKKPAKLRKAS
jgi:hypothetical protein